MQELRTGDVFAGYTIDRRLGAGGWGIVYLAQDPRLPRPVALKLLDPAKSDVEARHRFEREAELTARLDHPNIVTIYDRGIDRDIPWIAMQYVHGSDATAVAGAAPDRVLRIGAQIADALDHAHRAGVLHRDVKPSNFLLAAPEAGRPERVLLTDFGIARLRDATSGLTRTGSVTGTAAYISPEQVSGGEVDHRSDQYSLACSLFVLLTGQPPFEVTDPIALAHAHVYSPPVLPGTLEPELRILDPVFATALAKEPAERYRTCTEFVTAAQEALANTTGSAATAVSIPAAAASTPAPATVESTAISTTADSPVPNAAAAPAPSAATAHATAPDAVPATTGARRVPAKALVAAAGVIIAILALVLVYLVTGGNASDADSGTTAASGAPSTRTGAAGGHAGWDDRHAGMVAAFPELIGNMNANTGWRGATCRQNDPSSAEIVDYHDYARISCHLPMDGGQAVRFDILDRSGTHHAGLGIDELVTELFTSQCQQRPQDLPHPLQAEPVRVVTCAGVDYSRDTEEIYLWSFFHGAEYSPYVLVTHWPGHTVDELLTQWWAPAPLGK